MKNTLAGVECLVCGDRVHFMALHLDEKHDMETAAYLREYPGAPLVSRIGELRMAEMEAKLDNPKEEREIKELFGVKFSKMSGCMAFRKPHSSTPILDPDYSFRSDLLKTCLYAMSKKNEPVLLTGPTGSGKSSVVMQLAARLNWGFYRIAFDADLTHADFIGQWQLKSGETVFEYGLLPRAMKEGTILLLDEWDSANPSVAMLLQPVLEGSPLTITETGEIIPPHENFRIFATSNTIGQGDSTGLYNGTQPQNFAALDRFKSVDVVDYPSQKEEREIIKRKLGIEDADAINKMIEVAKNMREGFVKGKIMATMSTRTILNVAEKIIDYGDVKRAYEIGYFNKLNNDDKAFAKEILQRVWGTV